MHSGQGKMSRPTITNRLAEAPFRVQLKMSIENSLIIQFLFIGFCNNSMYNCVFIFFYYLFIFFPFFSLKCFKFIYLRCFSELPLCLRYVLNAF